MRFGKIRIENNELRFSRRVKSYVVPCEDIRWAYRRKEESNGKICCGTATFTTNSVIILTKMEKRYQFEMTEEEAIACLTLLKECNENLIVGFPRGGPLPLTSVFNTRDLGGIKTDDGRHILPYQLLRSGELYHLSPQDQELLREEYHLKTILDFRTEAERADKPDTDITGTCYIENPILEEETLGITHGQGVTDMLLNMDSDPEETMIRMYQQLVIGSYSKNQYAKFFQYLLENGEGTAILWHCSAGKDRAGVATMLLLMALGVPRGTIMDDYMRTNICLKKDVEYLTRLLASRKVPDKKIECARVMLSAKECYLQSALNTIQAEYGSMERYLRRAMCLTPRHLERLKKRYLV